MEGASPEPPTGYLRKLNEKMDTVLEKLDTVLGKKQKRSTIAEVNSKVDNLLEVIEKKQKVEYI